MKRNWSRRHFLESAAAVAVMSRMPAAALGQTPSAKTGKLLAYVGTYTSPMDGRGNGGGIYLCEMDVHTGGLTLRGLVAKTANPSWIAIHPTGKFLYAVNEVKTFNGNSGSVSAFAIDRGTGDLALINTVSSEGAGPAHMSIDATGKFAFVANYAGGSIAVLPILADGSLGPAVDVHRDSGATGLLGNLHAASGPPGSFAISGHDAPHAHMIAPDPGNKFVVATDLGQDRIYVYRFDAQTGKLTVTEPIVTVPSGDGPRHFAFHPNGRWFYTIQEEASTIAFFHFDTASGALTSVQTISTLPEGFAGTSYCSEIAVSPDGRFLYGANRLHDTIAVFAIHPDGRLARVGEASTLGDYPRHFRIDPTGNFLYVSNQRSDCITCFRIHRDTGLLSFTGQYMPVGDPSILAFLT
jgi:6-phosphogluconolactonase (cycloisomerase 2 family)